MEIGKTIKQHRTELGWSQEVLAERAYVSRQTVSNWETEKSYPDVHSLLILSDLLGVSLDELIKGDVAVMKEQVKSKDVRTFKKLQLIGGLGILLLIVTGIHDCPYILPSVSKSDADFRNIPEVRTPLFGTLFCLFSGCSEMYTF